MNIAKKYTKLTLFLKWVGPVVLIAVAYYYWERYLFGHFLGGFNERGVAVPHSRIGFYFFIKAWPVWFFPLALGLTVMTVWKQKRLRELRTHLCLIEQDRINQQTQLSELQTEIQILHDHIKRRDLNKQDSLLYNDEKVLQTRFNDLKKDYQRSQEFIEKLLDKINSSK